MGCGRAGGGCGFDRVGGAVAEAQGEEGRRAQEGAVALAEEEAKIPLEGAEVDFEVELDAAALKIKKARDDANEMKQEAREAAKWEGAGLSQSPHTASLIAHTILTLSFLSLSRGGESGGGGERGGGKGNRGQGGARRG